MNNLLRYAMKRTLKLLLWALAIYAVALPILFWMYRSNRGFDWWSILGGDPRVSPEFRGFLIRTNHPLAPSFDVWQVTKALPFQVMGWLTTVAMFALLVVVLLAGLHWLLSRGRTYVIYPRENDVTFDDVRGQPEVVAATKQALSLFPGFKRFRAAGGYPPHGILFEGRPGSGRTLLGKAIAGSAKVPFVYAPAASFVDTFMGVGGLRVAWLFRKARRLSRRYGGAVVFIDELGTVGGSRGAAANTMGPAAARGPLRPVVPGGPGLGGGSTYVSELLLQLDAMAMPRGLWRHLRRLLRLGRPKAPRHNLVVIGSTDQASTLDPALLRAGRFDRRLHLGLPTADGRQDIIAYYLDTVPHDQVDIGRLARATFGFSPAQIRNLVNQALVYALMDGRDRLNFADLWTAKATEVTEEIGVDQTSRTSWRDRQMAAFHEAGHAVLGYVLELDDQIQVASIIKRRDALGVVYRTPLEERHTELREDLRRDVVVSFGGLAAEEIWFGDISGGSSTDLRDATTMAAAMAGHYGMGDSLISYAALGDGAGGEGPLPAILGNTQAREWIGKLLADCKAEAVELLRRNEPAVRALAERLLEKDEVHGEEIEELMLAKGVARAAPSFRPVLELLGESWHQPALVESLPAREAPPRHDDDARPRPAPEAP